MTKNITKRFYDAMKSAGKSIGKIAGATGLAVMLLGKPALAEDYPLLPQRTQEYTNQINAESATEYQRLNAIKNYLRTDDKGNYYATPQEMSQITEGVSRYTDKIRNTRIKDKKDSYKNGVDDTRREYRIRATIDDLENQENQLKAYENGTLTGRIQEQEENKPFYEAKKRLAIEKALKNKPTNSRNLNMDIYTTQRYMINSSNKIDPINGIGIAISDKNNVIRIESHIRKADEPTGFGSLNTYSSSLALSIGRILGKKQFGNLETSTELSIGTYNEKTSLQGKFDKSGKEKDIEYNMTGPIIEGTLNFDLKGIHLDIGRRQYLKVTNMDHTGENIVRIGINNKNNKKRK